MTIGVQRERPLGSGKNVLTPSSQGIRGIRGLQAVFGVFGVFGVHGIQDVQGIEAFGSERKLVYGPALGENFFSTPTRRLER